MSVAASNGKTVLITGIGGYIAGVLGHLLLIKGYHIRGTTRKASSLEPLLKGAYAPYIDRVKIYEVSDITADGAFDEAVQGVDGIFHTASPVDFSKTTYDEFVTIAKRGNETLLASALNAGPQLSSVVVTSSVAAIIDPKEGQPEYTYTEADWASGALEEAERDRKIGGQTPPGRLYSASKTAADQAFWKFRDAHKPSFALTTINPSVVIGPPAVLASSGSKLNATVAPIYRIFAGATDKIPPNIGSGSYVDVRDVAFQHVWAFEHSSEADGQRYIACQGFGPNQAAADILREHYRGTKFEENIVKGTPGEGYDGYNNETGAVDEVKFSAGKVRVDGSKAAKAMGLRYIPFKQSVIETAKALEPLVGLASDGALTQASV